MNTVERLEAAVAVLERLRVAEPYHESHGWLVSLVTIGMECDPREEEAPLTNSDLLVTLHRTIDAQLDVLRAGLQVVGEVDDDPAARYSDGRRMDGGRIMKVSAEGRAIVALADAILAGTP